MSETHHRTVAYVDEAALRANLARVREATGRGVETMAVVKADAYGHGAGLVAPVLQDAGADRFGVATVEEAVELRRFGIERPILVLYGIDPRDAPRAIEHDLAVGLVDAAAAQALAQAAGQAAGRGRLRVHLEVDTGMTRLGVRPEEAVATAEAIRAAPSLQLEGVFSHLGSSDDATLPFVAAQVRAFRDVVATLDAAGLRPPLLHLANSAGTLTRADTHWDVVRPGVCLYGVRPASARCGELQPVMCLTSHVWRVWDVPPGCRVSYDQTFVTQRKSRIAVLPVGYADGYWRTLSNRGTVVVRGCRAPVVGRVCLDVTMIDVTDVADVRVGDPVVLWGRRGGMTLPVDEIARACDTIAYEVLARVGRRVPRIKCSNAAMK